MIRSALISLHLPGRAAMLGAFLEALGIPHEGGLITDGTTVTLPTGAKLSAAIEGLVKQYPAREVLIYLVALVAMDPETWNGLAAVIPTVASQS
jgi:hypothetical protein